jgi:hypothetical protein
LELDIVDVTFSAGTSGEARINLGDIATGRGYAASVTVWSSGDGFVGLPNAPTAGGQAAQALMLTHGNQRLALAIRDTRWDGQAGTLAPGDRRILSDCDAALLLRQAANSIELLSTDVGVLVDGEAGAVTVSKGDNTITVDETGARIAVGTGCSISATAAGIVLAFGATTLTVNAAGVQITTVPPVPGALVVNGSVLA